MSTLQSLIENPLNLSQPRGDFTLFRVKKTCDYSKIRQLRKQRSNNQRNVAFGNSLDRQTDYNICSPFLCYDINYSSIDPHQVSVRLKGNRMKRSITESSQIIDQHQQQKIKVQQQSIIFMPKISYNRPPSYFKVSQYQPMSNSELQNCFEDLLCKHGIKLPKIK